MGQGVEKHDITRPEKATHAAGKPGVDPTWSSGAKTLVGTATSARSRIWFTVSQGTLNEVYFPDVDQANTRSIRFLVTGPDDPSGNPAAAFFSDEQFDAEHTVTWIAPGAPGCHIDSHCKHGRYRLEKDIISDPVRDTLMVRVRFTPTNNAKLRLFLFVDVQVGDQGAENSAWIGHYKGDTLLIAQRGRLSLATVANVPLLAASAGFVGRSDGHHALSRHQPLPGANTADQGNVALTAEVDYRHPGIDGTGTVHPDTFIFAIAGGSDPAEAAQQARAGILQPFEKTCNLFVEQWSRKQAQYRDVKDLANHVDPAGQPLDMYRVSTAVLEAHQSKRFPGGFIASLSLPWGFDRSDSDDGGYHVLWPRDLVETAMGKLASGDAASARSALFYLHTTQESDGGWSQNMWLDGTPHWKAIQMDGIALPILLADQLRREDALDGYQPASMVRQVTCFLLAHGPVTQQDRWETTPGYSTYTMATEIAALLAAADCVEAAGDHAGADFLRTTADAWQDSLDELLYVTATYLADEHTVPGYYLRMSPPERIERQNIGHLEILMPNHPLGKKHRPAIDIVSPDVFALVRFGLRAASDPRITNTLKIIDATLKRETSTGPVWIRSTDDGYGEHADGAPFKKHGIGRGWPLLAGERAHFEIAAGNRDFALELLKTIARQTSDCGMIPEQVWDADDIPDRFLFNGHPAGSGMPLVWAHAEYIKLLRSLEADAIWDLPPQTVQRYIVEKRTASFQIWTPKQRRAFLAPGKDLRLDLPGPTTVTWHTDATSNQPATSGGLRTADSTFNLHTATLPASHLPSGSVLHIKLTPDQPSEDNKTDHIALTVA